MIIIQIEFVSSFCLTEITADEILNCINKLKMQCAPGIDMIYSNTLKLINIYIVETLHNVFNCSILLSNILKNIY